MRVPPAAAPNNIKEYSQHPQGHGPAEPPALRAAAQLPSGKRP